MTTKTGEEKNPFDRYEVNHSFLLYFSCILSLASTVQGGFALAESGLVGFALAEKNGWEKTGYLSNLTILTVAGQLGIAVGSLFGEKFSDKFGGIRKAILVSNILNIGACGAKLVEWLPFLIAGRLSSE